MYPICSEPDEKNLNIACSGGFGGGAYSNESSQCQ
jgi:hypothetical protein